MINLAIVLVGSHAERKRCTSIARGKSWVGVILTTIEKEVRVKF